MWLWLYRFLGPTGIKMVTNCLPLFYVRPDKHGNETILKRSLTKLHHELARSNSTPAMNEDLYDYARSDACALKHNNIHKQNNDVAVTIVTSPISAKSEPDHSCEFERRPPIPKPRRNKIDRSRSESNIVDACDEMYDTPYETASVTFNDSAEKLYQDSSNSPGPEELPPTPQTFELHFRSHSGWLVKLSKQKG